MSLFVSNKHMVCLGKICAHSGYTPVMEIITQNHKE
jgi:hypothetical protein